MGKLGYAIKCYTEALAIKSDPETMNFLVTAYTAKGEVAKAEQVVNQLVELDPTSVEYRLARVHILFMCGKEAEVVTDCDYIIASFDF